MKQTEEILQDREEYLERFHFSIERIKEIREECGQNIGKVKTHGSGLCDYFSRVSDFLLLIAEAQKKQESGELASMTLEEVSAWNHKLYEDVAETHYRNSYANPDYAAEKLGKRFSGVLCTLYTEIRSCIACVYENKPFYLAALSELFIEIYNLLELPETTEKELHDAIYYYFFDYAEIMTLDELRDSFDPQRAFAANLILNEDLSDLSYLYKFGEYITENELKTAEYLNTLTDEEIRSMAFTFTDGYRRGFELYDIDLSRKHSVNIRYHLGFERMIREVILQFKELGLSPCIYRAGVSISRRSLRGKIGFYGASPSKQYEYDHRMDDALFFDKAYADRKLQARRQVMEYMKETLSDFAGPAVIETFGEIPFNPVEKETALRYSEKQQEIKRNYQSESGILTNEYIPGDQTSFSIIAYPLPEIGKQFQEIFKETIRVNTLDQTKYLEIQTKIINALDQGDFVTVTGRNDNRTDIRVALTPVNNPEKETKFENCLADVNIPLGEVFTSPKLTGTTGTLHVTRVFLNDLEYHDLILRFEDGVITDYSCKNFETEEENRKYISENVLFHHKTLPMGEFAIGTNTTAYVMGKKYDISHLLPILITEKTGPHFAVGDTCFSHEENLVTYNPDGKQMTAKENDFSKLRNTDPSKAYFNCHTDITIPYDELGNIIVHTEAGKEIAIIREGRFVLEGTEALNKPFTSLP